MSVSTFDIDRDVITVTPAAAAHLKAQLDARRAAGVRISVKESGCTGYMYVFEEVDQAGHDDIVVRLENGVSVFLDPKALPVVRGTEIDYAREGINRTLKLNNPNVTNACGCGESFSID